MKHINTTIKTGDNILYNGSSAVVGTYKQGVITIRVMINATSCISLFYSTKKINQLIASGSITKLN